MTETQNTHIWEKSYPEGLNWQHQIDAQPVWKLLDDAVARFPRQAAIEFLGTTLTYAQLDEAVSKFAKGLQKNGVTKGTKVGIFLPNCPQFIISYYAILKAGGVVVNFSPLYSEDEIKHQIEDAEVEMMITLNLQLLYPKLRSLLGTAKFTQIVCGKMQDYLPFPKNILFGLVKGKEIAKPQKEKGILAWSDLMSQGKITQTAPCNAADDTAVIQYTGGTTGTPKGAELTHANVYINAMQCAHWFHKMKDGEGRNLGVLPFFHVFAMTTVMNLSLAKGLEIVLHPRFELEKVLKDITAKKPLLMLGVPTMFNAINNHPNIDQIDISSVQYCFSGGAALPVEVKQKFEKHSGGTLVEGYGLTETSPVVCGNPIWGQSKAGSIGLPFPQTEVRIEDIENREHYLPVGEKGELCIKGPQVMKGYWKNEAESKDCMTKEGFFRTGDIAMLDDDGYVFIVDRLKEMINSGGFKIYPRNVEEVIYQHEAVAEAAVLGIPDDYKGQAVKAVVVLKPNTKLLEEELLFFLSQKLGKHEIPAEIEFRDALPKTMIGKISKKDI